MATGDTNTLNQANEYTDIAIQQLIGFDASELEGRVTALEARFDDVDRRLHQQARRLDRLGAMSPALLPMATTPTGTPTARRCPAPHAPRPRAQRGPSRGD